MRPPPVETGAGNDVDLAIVIDIAGRHVNAAGKLRTIRKERLDDLPRLAAEYLDVWSAAGAEPL